MREASSNEPIVDLITSWKGRNRDKLGREGSKNRVLFYSAVGV